MGERVEGVTERDEMIFIMIFPFLELVVGWIWG